jgi:hypothetical protein
LSFTAVSAARISAATVAVLSERKFMRRYLVQSSSSICSRFRVVFHDTFVQ